ncbi:hypothetical protein E4U41_004973 [Claviceps citrina]|nr:hypothetical protein E4U41_004973 [Claviceps citrina]
MAVLIPELPVIDRRDADTVSLLSRADGSWISTSDPQVSHQGHSARPEQPSGVSLLRYSLLRPTMLENAAEVLEKCRTGHQSHGVRKALVLEHRIEINAFGLDQVVLISMQRAENTFLGNSETPDVSNFTSGCIIDQVLIFCIGSHVIMGTWSAGECSLQLLFLSAWSWWC